MLNGQNRFTASSIIEDGSVEAVGLFLAPFQIAEFAKISGTGTVNSLEVRGVLAAGNATAPTGTLTTAGPLQFTSTSELLTTCNDLGGCSKLSALSGASLGGTARLQLLHVPSVGNQFLLIQAQGGSISGTFSSVATNLGVLGSLSYSPTQVNFVVTSEDPIFSDGFDRGH